MRAWNRGTLRLTLISMLAAGGLVLFVFESFLPIPPWFRPGLGNIATIIALFLFSLGDSLKVTVLRVVLGSLVLGRLFTPLFMLAITGSLASAFTMWLVKKAGRGTLGPVGVSVAGAVVHNLVQLAAAYLLFVKSIELFIFIPIFSITGIITGVLTGLVSAMTVERMEHLVSE